MNNSLQLMRATSTVLNYLSITDAPREADIIWGLGSNDLLVPKKAAELFHAHLAPTIVFSGGNGHRWKDLDLTEAEFFRNAAIAENVPESKIVLEKNSIHTGENVTFSFRLLDSLGVTVNSALLITIPPFQRRAEITVRTHRESVQCFNCPVNWGRPETWTSEKLIHVAELCIGEIERLREYPNRGFIKWDPLQIPDEVISATQDIKPLLLAT